MLLVLLLLFFFLCNRFSNYAAGNMKVKANGHDYLGASINVELSSGESQTRCHKAFRCF